ncbi:MAG: hypothetical protein G01um101417_325 [Parcubacteria group bacterium Gr01-1014_17]|nr:MAG: hypothetical protein G01um101417_325 [Parcubacteria group bacterium Gr01-1014_17]
MKTIFISILSGVEAKAILRTDILGTLLARGNIRVVLFVKNAARAAFYEKEFLHPRVCYEVIDAYAFSPINTLFDFLKNFLVRTNTLALYRRLLLIDRKNVFVFVGGFLFSALLARPLFQRIARFLDASFVRDQIFYSVFERYRPSLVFLANLFDTVEVSMLREAKRRGIRSVGFVNSWDKIASKGFLRLVSDVVIAPNHIVKEEAIYYDNVPREKIFVSGVPQYDMYWSIENILPREVFFQKMKMDPKKRLIIFGPIGKTLSNSDWEMIDTMHSLLQVHIPETQMLARFQPNDFAGDEAEFRKRPWLHVDVPGVRFGTGIGMDWDMTAAELLHLKNTLFHCALLVSYASSISIDAAVFDKPIINIGFEIRHGDPAWKQPTRRYATVHYQKALATGGIRLVKSEEELIEWIKKYLAHPQLDRKGRARLVHEQCVYTDGKTGKRIADFLLRQL